MDDLKDSTDDANIHEKPPTWEDVMREKNQSNNAQIIHNCDVIIHDPPLNNSTRSKLATQNFINGEKAKHLNIVKNDIFGEDRKSLYDISEKPVESKQVNGYCVEGNPAELLGKNGCPELTTKEKFLAVCAKIYKFLTAFCQCLLIVSELTILVLAILAIVYVSSWGLKWSDQKPINGCRKFYSPYIDKLEEAIVIAGYVTMFTPCLVGLLGAWFKQRKLLKFHNYLLIISLIIQTIMGFHFFRNHFMANYQKRIEKFRTDFSQFYGYCEVQNEKICSCEIATDVKRYVAGEENDKKPSYLWRFINRKHCTYKIDLKCFYDADKIWYRGFWFATAFFSAQVSALLFGLIINHQITSKYLAKKKKRRKRYPKGKVQRVIAKGQDIVCRKILLVILGILFICILFTVRLWWKDWKIKFGKPEISIDVLEVIKSHIFYNESQFRELVTYS